MANFATHAVAGAVLGGSAALGGWLTGALSLPWSAALWGVTWAASLAPDLDARSSIPARWLWDGLALGMAGWILMAVPLREISALRLFLAAAMGLAVRGPISRGVMQWTRHRGLWHSLQAALLVGAVVGDVLYRFTRCSQKEQLWISGAAVAGFLLHLILDEAFSVDLNNARVRRSFGSALKIWDARSPGLSFVLTGMCFFCLAVFGIRFL